MRKESKAAKQTLGASTSAEQLEILSDLSALFAESNPISESMAEEKTLREHAAPQVNQALLCIATPTLQAPLELKSGLIHLLPKFRWLMNEDPYQHLKESHVVCSSMKPERVTEEQIKLRALLFSLDSAAKEWLFYLPAGSITSWEGMMRLFLDRYFPSSRVINVRRDICGIKEKVTETLFDYWERFKKLCASCPQHDTPEQSLLHYFYEGLLPTERSKIDYANGGSMEDKTPTEARKLIDTMAATSRKPQPPPSQQPSSSSRSDSSLEDIVKSLALNTQQFQMSTQQFQNETRSSIQSLESQVSKLATSMSKLEFQGKLPSQTEVNPRQNVRAITLRSEKEIEELAKTVSRGHGSSAEAEPEAEVINSEVHETVELHQQENLGIVLSGKKSKESSNTGKKSEILAHKLEAMNPKCGNSLSHDSPSSHTKVFSSLVRDPELKLKQLPKHLKHAFLEAQVEEERLITTLREYKDAIGRVITDVKGFKPSTFVQGIVLEQNYKPIQEAQNHLNPPMMEVFKKEFQKLLDTDKNYFVLDSKIGGKLQWAPKKTGVAVMKSSELGENIVPKPPD
ncbi:hypothetical protein G2W53_022250 [Senna tora]|uniref:Retrotransposon gag domain-containing protein n=1 Tax=Senna tora TaxID=362788 RepID=A0A834WLW9_9FABA|nr:hypothetical protein G2W53_022250 [Senna tora]